MAGQLGAPAWGPSPASSAGPAPPGEVALYVKQLGPPLAQLSADLGELGRELVRARAQLADSSRAAALHEAALLKWTRVLSWATIAYTILTGGPLLIASIALLRQAGLSLPI